MLARVGVVAFNAYREAVRARVLHGLFGLAIATAAYSLVVGAYASQSQMRVVSDLGAASISLYAVIVAIVLGATSLYRELEQKTIFPVLARPIRRAEYLVGKLLGTLLTTRLRSTLEPSLAAIGLPPESAGPIQAAAGHGQLDPSLLGSLQPGQRTAVVDALTRTCLKIALSVALVSKKTSARAAERPVASGKEAPAAS